MGCDGDDSWYKGGGGGRHQLYNMKMASYLFNEFNRFLRLVIFSHMSGLSVYSKTSMAVSLH